MKDARPERRAGLLLHGRRRALADQLPARRRHQPRPVEHAHVHERRGRQRLLALRDACPAAGTSRSATCDDGSPVSNIDVGAGRDRHLHVHEPASDGSLVIVKDARRTIRRTSPSPPAAGSRRPASSLDDDADGTLSNTRTFTNVPTGIYSVAETVPAGWDQTERHLQRRQPGVRHRRRRRRDRHLHLHEPQARAVIVVQGRPARTTRRTSRSRPAAGSPRRASRSTTTRTRRSRTRARSPTCRSAAATRSRETVPSGWDQSRAHAATTAAPSRTSTWPPARSSPARSRTTSAGQIVVVKDATPNDAQDFAFTAGGGLARRASASTTTPTGRCRTRARSRTSRPAPATRSPRPCPSGWDQTAAICDDGSPVSNIDVCARARPSRARSRTASAAAIVVVEGRHAQRRAGLLLHGRRRPLARRASSSTTTPTGRCRTRARSTTSRRATGYSLSETVPERLGPDRGHRATTAARCRTSTSPPGETVTCTFANRKRGQLVVVRTRCRTTPRTSRSRPAGGLSPGELRARRRLRRDARRTRHTFAGPRPGVGLLGGERDARRLGPRLARPVTTAAPSRTSTSPRARPSPARS